MLHHLHYYKRISDNSAFQNDLNFFSSPLAYAIDLSTTGIQITYLSYANFSLATLLLILKS